MKGPEATAGTRDARLDGAAGQAPATTWGRWTKPKRENLPSMQKLPTGRESRGHPGRRRTVKRWRTRGRHVRRRFAQLLNLAEGVWQFCVCVS